MLLFKEKTELINTSSKYCEEKGLLAFFFKLYIGHVIFGHVIFWTCDILDMSYLDMWYLENDGYGQGKWSEWPMFRRNVDSFPFRWISGARYVHFLAKVMPKFQGNFGMTCKVGISSAGICCDGNETAFQQTIDLFHVITHFIIV